MILKQTFCFLYFFLFIGLFSHEILLAQDETLADSLYREDQIYLGVSSAVLLSDQSDFKPQGLSRHFQFGVVRDIPLSENGQFDFSQILNIEQFPHEKYFKQKLCYLWNYYSGCFRSMEY